MKPTINTIDYNHYAEAISIAEQYYATSKYNHVSNVAKLIYTMTLDNKNRKFVDDCIHTAYLHHILDDDVCVVDNDITYKWDYVKLLRAGFNMDVVSAIHVFSYKAVGFADFLQHIKPYCISSKVVHMVCLTDLNDMIASSGGVEREMYTVGASYILK